MDTRMELLMAAFQFEPVDLAANREGRLTPRQQALLRAGRFGMWLSLAIFAVVTAGGIAFMNAVSAPSSTPSVPVSGSLPGGAVVLAIGAVLVVVALLISLPYIRAARRPRQVEQAEGKPSRAKGGGPGFPLRVGQTVLRLPSAEHAAVFDPDTEYRVFYLNGPVHVILSAEVVGAAFDPDAARLPASGDLAAAQMGVFRRGYALVVMIGALALAVPVAGVAIGRASPAWQTTLWAALVAALLAFTYGATRWLTIRR